HFDASGVDASGGDEFVGGGVLALSVLDLAEEGFVLGAEGVQRSGDLGVVDTGGEGEAAAAASEGEASVWVCRCEECAEKVAAASGGAGCGGGSVWARCVSNRRREACTEGVGRRPPVTSGLVVRDWTPWGRCCFSHAWALVQ